MKSAVWAGASASLLVVALVIACGGSSSPPIADGGSSSGNTTSGASGGGASSGGTGTGSGTSSGSGSSSGGGGGDGGASEFNRCNQPSDCEWGEIDHEILAKKDCMCLFGCPYLPLNKTTVKRRQEQFKSLCDGRTDGNGKPCPIDDCARPGPIDCRNGVCAAPSKDAGRDDEK